MPASSKRYTVRPLPPRLTGPVADLRARGRTGPRPVVCE
ncbi:hypothetical protein SEA_IKELOA_227 [Mycobacterium phage IkeLoa]|nr:hypothetical protein SEA_IOTA_230 [Mycobacterium phage Iota]URP21505.1 hypothetical protein SEA_MCGEE_234 [Mycobacterium phage McGee]UVD40553.1 hypothetical protein SEA_IKELOA_227 [Mycobacterium phage IkeLoa]WNM64789.1 hypothetical protein SEA_GAMGAM__235 [Mycobacterium phage Gamgam]WNT45776.1 hypothetical protein SEA_STUBBYSAIGEY_239 [Mycobacterium phage StubbySaigey]